MNGSEEKIYGEAGASRHIDDVVKYTHPRYSFRMICNNKGKETNLVEVEVIFSAELTFSS